MNNSNKILLILGLGLVTLGWFRPSLDTVIYPPTVTSIAVEAPTTKETKEACLKVISSLKKGPDPYNDGKMLASLFSDMARLIALDGKNEIIKTTEEIVQANKVAGILLQMNLKDKYDNLSEYCEDVVVSVMGEDSALLDDNLRQKAVSAFKNLAWACEESSK